ncbi:hypothetical protein [Bacillus sp. 7884-1]|uniref:hypothetical protein n=1 Tax=Bacillus sp. 7884-1 TaxID=2021693 RepID=UPI000BA7946B|nr:hypothetical protein [Bacillus sp. 7884-1]PAE33765.1 hypothetical protein CHI06_25345 [Bacillus sp. 7884-1]
MSNRFVYASTALLVLIIIGMLVGSFRLIIYPYIVLVGILLLIGLAKKIIVNKKIIWIPTIVTFLFLLLQGWLDIATLHSPIGGGNLILGFTISTAIYYVGIWTLCASFSLIYVWTFSKPEVKKSSINTNSLDI